MHGGEHTGDFEAYLGSRDARDALPWQLAVLAQIRTALNRPLTEREYARLRSALRTK